MNRGNGVRRDPVCGKRITRNGAHAVFEREPDRYVRTALPKAR